MGDSFVESYKGTYLERAEAELYERFLSRLDAGQYHECEEIAKLMERLNLI